VKQRGTFGYLDRSLTSADVAGYMKNG